MIIDTTATGYQVAYFHWRCADGLPPGWAAPMNYFRWMQEMRLDAANDGRTGK